MIPSEFAHDIFISYRQKDNSYDSWVSEFIVNLRKELEATFKEDIFIYTDENKYDGIREMHLVDDSLSSKLKCLIFIPIISQTYCDPKSYAWKNEFLVFKELAAQDSFGLKIKLQNGNFVSRIVPVRIHDLESQDKLLFENETGGPLRSVDFIFKAPYKGDTTALSKEGAEFDVKGESLDEKRNQEESARQEKGACKKEEVVSRPSLLIRRSDACPPSSPRRSSKYAAQIKTKSDLEMRR